MSEISPMLQETGIFIVDWNRRTSNKLKVLDFLVHRVQGAFRFQVQNALDAQASPRAASKVLYELKKAGIVNYSTVEKLYTIDRNFRTRIEQNLRLAATTTTTTVEEKHANDDLMDHAQYYIKSDSSVSKTSPKHLQSISLPSLSSSISDKLGQPYINPMLDPMKTGPPPPGKHSGGGRRPRVDYVPLTDEEKDLALTAVQMWSEEKDAPPSAGKIVKRLLANCFAFGKNQLAVESEEHAASFCDLPVEEFKDGIRLLANERRAYYYKQVGKFGLYVDWLSLLRRGLF